MSDLDEKSHRGCRREETVLSRLVTSRRRRRCDLGIANSPFPSFVQRLLPLLQVGRNRPTGFARVCPFLNTVGRFSRNLGNRYTVDQIIVDCNWAVRNRVRIKDGG